MTRGAIQFATSLDGMPIAYWSIGSGSPLIAIHNFTISHVELEWEVPSNRVLYEALAERHQVIRLDPRGTGLSGSTPDPSLDGVVADVEAVADALGHAQFDLIATHTMAPVGIRLATTERVRRLILADPALNLREDDGHLRKALRAGEAMKQAGAAEMISLFWTSGALPDDIEPLKVLTETNLLGKQSEWSNPPLWDGRPLLSDVVAPTLIIYTVDGQDSDQAREAAATIPDARLARVPGTFGLYSAGDEVFAALGDFLGWDASEVQTQSDFSVIVFTDIVASTQVFDRLGDEAARDAVRSVEETVASTAANHSGKVVKHLGDGSLLEFRSASNALDFARNIQIELADGDIGLRVGMAAGEPIHEDDDVHGAVVVVASRIADAAGAGQVFVSDGVRQLVVGKQYDFQDQGDQSIKGFDEPLRVWQLSP